MTFVVLHSLLSSGEARTRLAGRSHPANFKSWLCHCLLLSCLINSVRSFYPDSYSNSFTCNMANNASIDYQANVENLFKTFTSKAYSTGYYNTSIGRYKGKVYGYYMCRGDTTPQECRDCMVNSTRFARDAACKQEDGIYFSERCIFRYSNHSMYGLWHERLVEDIVPSGLPEPKTRQYNKTLNNTIERVIDKAAFGNQSDSINGFIPGFAVLEANVTGEETIYAMAQCTPDIIGVNCSKCLHLTIVNIRNYENYQGLQIYEQNCFVMYDNTSFYDIRKSPSPPYKDEGSRSPLLDSSISFSSKNNVYLFFVVFMLVSCIFNLLV